MVKPRNQISEVESIKRVVVVQATVDPPSDGNISNFDAASGQPVEGSNDFAGRSNNCCVDFPFHQVQRFWNHSNWPS